LEAASREPSVMARRSGVDESRAATTAKRSFASADASAADDFLGRKILYIKYQIDTPANKHTKN